MNLPHQVLRSWPIAGCDVAIVPVSAGFSGALVYRVESSQATCCLRGWPTGAAGLPEVRIRELHRWLAWLHAAGVRTVAVPIAAETDDTLVHCGGRLWQLEPWMPGQADFRHDPADARLRNAMTSLAQLHVAAETYLPTPAGREWFRSDSGPAPAVRERLQKLRRVPAALGAVASHSLIQYGSEQVALADCLARALPQIAPAAADELQHVIDIDLRLHPCLRDVWHDHILFSGDAVTGIIDPSAARMENVASDLSRLLGSLVGDDERRWRVALEAYSTIRPLSTDECRLARTLDRSGVVLSACHWMERMQHSPLSERELERVRALAGRMNVLAGRKLRTPLWPVS